MENGNFAVLHNLCKIKLQITTLSPLLIKSGENDLLPSNKDMRCIRNADNQVIIPGSTLKGFFKGNLDRLKDYLPSDQIEKSFGQQTFGSHFFFDECCSISETVRFESRPQIAIDRKTLGAKKGALMFLECVSKGAIFKGSITIRNFNIAHLGLVQAIIKLVNDQYLRLGSNKSRGFGMLKIDIIGIDMLVFNEDLVKISLNGNKLSIKINNKEITIEAQSDEIQKISEVLNDKWVIYGESANKILEQALNSIKK